MTIKGLNVEKEAKIFENEEAVQFVEKRQEMAKVVYPSVEAGAILLFTQGSDKLHEAGVGLQELNQHGSNVLTTIPVQPLVLRSGRNHLQVQLIWNADLVAQVTVGGDESVMSAITIAVKSFEKFGGKEVFPFVYVAKGV